MKMYQLKRCSVQTTPENLKMKQSPVYRDAFVFGKPLFESVFGRHWKSSGLKSVFEKLRIRFRDGFV